MTSVTGTQLMGLESDERSSVNGYPRAPLTVRDTGLPEDAIDAILAEQRCEWLAGEQTPAAAWLDRHPTLASNPALAAELVYHEFTLRQELGECPEWEDYLRQFPNFAEFLRLLRKADAVVGQTLIKAAFPSGSQLRHYELLGEIGRGGMGIVYKARQRSLDRLVALKTIRSGSYASDEERRRFQVEAQAVARLHHPNIVHIYEVGDADGEPFLALEFVEGHSLARRLRGVPSGPRTAALLVEKLARAVEYAHGMGVVHRDLKPSNVLVPGTLEAALDGCVPKITDFGLAKRLDKTGWTRSDAVLGTPSYMAPEQAASKPDLIDTRTDVYGLGALLYEMLTGRPPFRAESPFKTLQQVVETEPAKPSLLNPAVPRDLETVCLKCLEKEPLRRYSSAVALAEDLECWLRGVPVQARPVGLLGQFARWYRRRPLWAALIVALFLSLATGAVASFILWRRSVQSAAQALKSARKEQAAHQEAEEHYAMLRQLLTNNFRVNSSLRHRKRGVDDVSDQMLLDAEACLTRLLERRETDYELRALLADVLTRLGAHREIPESTPYFERAVRHWEQIPAGLMNDPRHLASRASAYGQCADSFAKMGRNDAARAMGLTSCRLWVALADRSPDSLPRDGLYTATWLVELVDDRANSKEEFCRRLEGMGIRLDLIGSTLGAGALFDVLMMTDLCKKCGLYNRTGSPPAELEAARKAGAILESYYRLATLDDDTRWRLAEIGKNISVCLRRARAADESLRLLELHINSLDVLARREPGADGVFMYLSQSWMQKSKAYWDLHQIKASLEACQRAVSLQREACRLAPAAPEYRAELGRHYLHFCRKLCELGQFDEAETVLRQRQTLWPGNIAKSDYVLIELRKWVKDVESNEVELSADERREQQNYLKLIERLEKQARSGQR
jgi:tRNA A-37 threonylcarbamoyl transferase component Bud32/tetratricopeptide (TPR) repeat protein